MDTSVADSIPTGHEHQFFIVGIGASAGGLEALEQFFSNLPADSGLAYVVIQHLSPTHKSHMVELLSRHTAMPVQHAKNNTEVNANTVYLIPPKKVMAIHQGVLKLADRGLGSLPSYPIDHFFESLASDRKDKAIGIVLSGTGSDGSRGLREIKEAGGVALAQDPDSAQFDGMPRSAISTMVIDHVSPASKLPEIVINYASNPLFKKKEVKIAEAEVTDAHTRILQIVLHYSGVDFRMYKSNTIRRRIEHRMGLKQIYDTAQYARYLEKSEDEVKRLYRELLIGVTRFFRDKPVFEAIESTVVPNLFKTAIEKGHSSVRCWTPGCSTGEEAYSLAMLLHEEQRRIEQHIEVKIFATDIDPEAIVTASSGLFTGSVVADLSPERLNQYFIRKDEHYQIARELRQMIIFAPHNILKDIPFSKVDLISCRNLLIYFNPLTQQKVLSNFTYALKPGGYLVLGSSEHISGKENLFSVVDSKKKIFKNKSSSPSLLASDLVVREKSTWSTNMGSEITPSRPTSNALSDHLRESLANYMPPSVVINLNYSVLYFFGDTNQFLRLPVGLANLNILKIVPSKIRTILGTALHKAFKKGLRVIYPSLSVVNEDESTTYFDLIVDPLKVTDEVETALVVFRTSSTGASPGEVKTEYNIEEETKNRIQDLERKLEYTEESLQAAIEELETSNEELQATNEELIASNEELQSTNEELQSTNEELSTVNSELQKKVQELLEINADMDYLLDSTDLCTIFLDEGLAVRKYTPAATMHFYLQASDIGRPIYHFTHSFGEIDFRAISQYVLTSGTISEQEISDTNGRKFLLRATPYKTSDSSPRGVVLMFWDITELSESPDIVSQQLEFQAKEFKQNQRKQDDLLYLTAHNLKSPLRAIRQVFEHLTPELSDEKIALLNRAMKEVNGMNDSIDDLISFTRIGHFITPEEEVNLPGLINEVREKLPTKNAVHILTDTALSTIKTHKRDLELVLYNIISSSLGKGEQEEHFTVSASTEDDMTTFTVVNESGNNGTTAQNIVKDISYPLNKRQQHNTINLNLEIARKTIEHNGGHLITNEHMADTNTYTFKWPTPQSLNEDLTV